MKLTMLGTGHATVTDCYNTCFVIEDEGKYFLVDGGGGNAVLSQLKKAGLRWQDMHEIFVTHKHLDHLTGVLWMIRVILQNMKRDLYEGEAFIYAHDEVIGILRELCGLFFLPSELQFLDKRLHLVEVHDGETRSLIGHDVTFFDIKSTKTKQFGFTLDMGNGRKLSCCGDEPFNECDRKYVEDSEWLLHEAFCLYRDADIFKPYEKNHSTVKEACEAAASLGVKNLVLYHTEDRHLAQRKALYGDEGRAYFGGNLFVPDDLEILEL